MMKPEKTHAMRMGTLAFFATALLLLPTSSPAQKGQNVVDSGIASGPWLTYNVKGASLGPRTHDYEANHGYHSGKGRFTPGTTIHVWGTMHNRHKTHSDIAVVSVAYRIKNQPKLLGAAKESFSLGPRSNRKYDVSADIPGNADSVEIRVEIVGYHSSVRATFRATQLKPFSMADLPIAPENLLSAGYRSKRGQTFRFRVVGATTGRVWGTGVYTDNSHPATAAVHAGILDEGQEGVVEIIMLEGRSSYTGSRRNGVESQSWRQFPGSFKFVIKK